MRYYSTKRINGSLHFVCKQCAYRVAVSSFDPHDGNTRTQAATTINQHAAVNHQSYGFANSGRKLVEHPTW
jgi:hypothetical protein